MKLIQILLICLILLAFNNSIHSQNKIDYSQPVNSGFFFLNGKYIETPYNFEVIDLAIYINGLQLDSPVKFPQFDNRVFEDPGMPQYLSKNLTVFAIDSIRTKEGGIWILRRIRYFNQNYSQEESYVKCIDFLKSLPFIRNVENHEDYNGIVELNDFYGNSRYIDLNPIEISPLPSLEELVQGLEKSKNRLIERLLKEDCIFYFTNSGEMSISKIKAAKILPSVLDVLEDNMYSIDEKKEKFEEYGLVQKSNARNQILIDNYIYNNQLHFRLNELRDRIKDEFGEEILKKKKIDSSKKEIKTLKDGNTAYSPDNTYLYIYYAHAHDHLTTYQAEIASITNPIMDQDYDITTNIWIDATSCDDNVGGCTLQNWKDCKNAGFLSIHSHGLTGLFSSVYTLTHDSAMEWISEETNMIAVTIAEEWLCGGELVPRTSVRVDKQWVFNNWRNDLSTNNAIVMVNSCLGANGEPSFLAQCGGRIGFGYITTCNPTDRTENNENLLCRMNGNYGNGQYREASAAYNDALPYFNDDFIIVKIPETYVTLCPATQEYYPEDGAIVNENGSCIG